MNSDGQLLRPMDLGGMLDTAIALYRRNFALFAGIVAVLGVPLALLSGLIRLAQPTSNQLLTNTGTSAAPVYHFHGDVLARYLTLAGGSVTLSWVFSTLMTAVLAIAISRRYLGQSLTVGAAYAAVGVSTFLALLGATILQGIGVGIGFILVVVPGFLVLIRWLFIPQALVLERTGVFGAFGRSWRLTRGSYWRIFGYGFVMYALVAIINAVVSGVFTAVLGALGTGGQVVGAGIAAFIVVLIQPFQIGFLTLLYYDLRIRKEGFDLEHMAQMMDARQPAWPART